mmetsp:Transcript_64331/g.153445  ORF Transcript_64331/g.153445 Transcript_64331/m.153445 type:complete len:95 (-) Transcript_64331:60-344(-)
MPDTGKPVAFTGNFQDVARQTPSPARDAEEERLRTAAENVPADVFAMAAYSRFLRFKRGDVEAADKWQRKAVGITAGRLSQNVTEMQSYFWSRR